jgi:hypothetical protein
MSQRRMLLITRLLVAFLLTAGVGATAEEEPRPWHVKEAEIRIPVSVAVKDALLRMPPQVYLADLKPTATTEGLTFDPKTKSAIRQDARKPEERAKLIAEAKARFKKEKRPWDPDWYYGSEDTTRWVPRVKGSATFAIKPEYKWFSWRPNHAKIYIDGELIPEEKLHQVTWEQWEDRRWAKEGQQARLAAIPPGAKTLKIEAGGLRLDQPGFITKSPAVTRATLCLADRDPSTLIPIVHRLGGERVGCRIVWAEPGKPMTILFDSSSGDEEYLVYLVDRAKNPTRLDWAPKAGLIQEARYLERYDPEVETWEGFQKLWNDARVIAGKKVPELRLPYINRNAPERVIWTGHLPFGSKREDMLNYISLRDAAPPALSRYTGFFHIPETNVFKFYCTARPGGYFLIDGQMVVKFRGQVRTKGFSIELEKGMHRFDLCQYNDNGNGLAAGLWWFDPNYRKGDHPAPKKFGSLATEDYGRQPAYMVWEPVADSTAGASESPGQRQLVSFEWYKCGQILAPYPALDINWYRFTANMPGLGPAPLFSEAMEPPNTPTPPPNPDGPVFRWRFHDGTTAEGRVVEHVFFSPGPRTVQLEVLDRPDGKVIARTSGKIYVQVNLAVPRNTSFKHRQDMLEQLWEQAEEHATKQFALDELVSLFFFSYPYEHVHGRFERWAITKMQSKWPEKVRKHSALALARRADELIDAYPYSRLLQVGQSLMQSQKGPTAEHYAAAEKLLKVVMDRAPAGSYHWRSAASSLADLYISVGANPEKGRALLEKLEQTEPTIDMDQGWQMAKARRIHYLTDTDKADELTKGREWSPMTRPFDSHTREPLKEEFESGRGVWLTNEFHLPASWKGKELVLNPGTIHGGNMTAWFNGQPLGRMWQWPDRNIVVPAGLPRRGAKNRLTLLYQPRPQSYQPWRAPPVFSPDLKRRAWIHDGRIQVGENENAKRRQFGGQPASAVSVMAFSPDGKLLASGHEHGGIKLWSIDTGMEVRAIDSRSLGVVALTFSPDGKHLVSGSEDSQITLWDTASGKMLRSFSGHASEVLDLAFSGDGKRLASASFDKTVKIWDIASGRVLRSIEGHTGPVNAVAFSPDGKSVASGIDKARIRLWDANSGKEIRTLDGQQGEVTSLAFSADGSRLASGSREQLVCLWDLEKGSKVATLSGHTGPVVAVMFSPDDKQFVSLGGEYAKYWTSDTGSAGRQIHGLEHSARVPYLAVYGLHTMAKGYESYPAELYTTDSCEEIGLNYACYYGKWEKLPDFDALKPDKAGVLKHVDSNHINGALLPYWKIYKKDGRDHRELQPSGMKLHGYVRVIRAADFEFALKSGDGSRLCVDSKLVIDNDGMKDDQTQNEEKRGAVHLQPGVHSITITFFHAEGVRHLFVTFPHAFVRDLTVTEVTRKQATANALLLTGETDEAKQILTTLERDKWPLDDQTHWQLTNTLRSIHRWAGRNVEDVTGAFEAIEQWQQQHPMLRTVPEFMIAKIETLVSSGDYVRAFTLVDQLRQLDLSERQKQYSMLMQVKWSVRAGRMDAARDVYQELKRIAPTSTATADAREAIKQAVLKQFEKD